MTVSLLPSMSRARGRSLWACTLALATAAAVLGASARASAASTCRPGAPTLPLQTGATLWSVAACGGGIESIRLTEPQFELSAPQPPSGALPGWARDKWAAGPLQLVSTWDASWDPFQDRAVVSAGQPLLAQVRPTVDAPWKERSFASVKAMYDELPRHAVRPLAAGAVEVLWPDPALVRAPLLVRKVIRPDPSHRYMARSEVALWWFGGASEVRLEHVLRVWQNPADADAGFFAMLAGPPDLKGASMRNEGEARYFDINALGDAEAEERTLGTLPQWLAVDSRYFVLATVPTASPAGGAAELVSFPNGVVQATLRSAPLKITAEAPACLPAAVAAQREGSPCAADLATLGLTEDEAAVIDAKTLDAAASKVGSEAAKAAAARLRARAVVRWELRHYAGPKEIDALRDAGADLDDAIDFGWFSAIARPLLFVLRKSNDIFGSWPFAILLLTVLVKVLLWPIMGKSQKSMIKMAALKPELDKIREDLTADAKRRGMAAADPNELNRATFALYQKHGVNPLSGCLPLFIQMPVYIALYRTISSSVELFNRPLFGWIGDLTQRDPYYVLPVLLSVLMVVQQKVTPMATTDEAQRKMMTYVMPVMFGMLMLGLPSGLTWYILVNTILGIGQSWWFQRERTMAQAKAGG